MRKHRLRPGRSFTFLQGCLKLCLIQFKPSALLLSLGAALVLLVRAGTSIRTVLSGIARLAGQADSGAFSCLVRSAAIVLLTDYTRTLCEEAGAESLGWCVGLAGRCLVLAAAWPLLEEILQTIGSIAR